ncbi:MAG: c-type cytochrome [Vicinamibacterales bacterium]
MTLTRWRAVVTALALAGTLAVMTVSGQQPAPAWNGIYTDAQATRGAKVYQLHCVFCHGKDLAGGNLAPAAGGPAFVAKWQSRPLRELFGYLQTRMPFHNPNTLSRQDNADVLAFMLQYSKVPSGARDFAGDLAVKGDPNRGEAFYTEAQAERGRFAFNRNCALCHSTADSKMTQEQVNASPFPPSLAAPYLGRVFHGKMIYPTVYHLYTKLQSMPAFGSESITNDTRADIIAHILERNGFPAGDTELRPDVDLMGQLMLNEAGFEHVFNGRDFANIKFVLGTRCGPEPGGCARTEPLDTLQVLPGGRLYCKCEVHGYWYYSAKKFLNFTVRFQHKFVKPEGWVGDEDIYMGGGGWLMFIQDTNMQGFGKSIEVEGRVRDMADIFFLGGGKGKFTYDNAAKTRAVKPFDWNDIEIVSKDGQVKTYVNGALSSTITEHDYPAGFFGMQVEGSPTEWRNIRIRPE